MLNELFFSIVIPAHNEEGSIASTCEAILSRFKQDSIDDYELLVVNDNSSDRTESILKELSAQYPSIRYVNNEPPHGFGFAVQRGLREFRGQSVAIVMAVASRSSLRVA